jgi:FkbM family methyltransferase
MPLATPSELARQIAYQRRLAALLGWRDAIRFRAAMLGARFGWHDGVLLHLKPAALRHPVALRLRSTDADVYGQVIRREEYRPAAGPEAPAVIVDCGANVGFTSAYLLSRFPAARVIAIEPFPTNAALCRQNLAPYGPRAQVLEAAVWSRCTTLSFEQMDGNEWGVRVSPTGIGAVRGIDIPSLGLPRIDLLKIDIEGSEQELFSNGAERWLPSVANIAIELHGQSCSKAFFAALAGYEYALSHHGELTLCHGIRRRS